MFEARGCFILLLVIAATAFWSGCRGEAVTAGGAEEGVAMSKRDQQGDLPEDPRQVSDEEWRRRLTPEQYAILRKAGTERPGSGEYDDFFEHGRYLCAACGNELFRSEAKFDSGCGWPAFDRPADEAAVDEQVDRSHGMVRTEVRCARCGGHLGHVFGDGPRQTTGQRYCINSGAMQFKPAAEQLGTAEGATSPGAAAAGDEKGSETMQMATFGAGCFWGVEETFRKLDGVTETTVGYSGGTVENPSYEQVCTDRTGHAEVVQVKFDPRKVSYEKLLEVFWGAHDPTQLNRQGPDVGRQYRSVIFYHDEEQKKIAEASRAALEASKRFSRPIATEIVPAKPFYRAEEYHQQYLRKRGQGSCPSS